MSGNRNGDAWEIRLLEFVVRLMVPQRRREEFLGDLLEEWSSSVVPQRGKLKGLFWLSSQLLRSVIPMGCVWIRGLFLGDDAMFNKLLTSTKLISTVCLLSVVVFLLSAVSTMEFLLTAKAVLDLIGHLLLFALLMACAVKWQRSMVAASLPVIWVAVVLVGHAPFFQLLTVQHAYPGLLALTLASFAANAIGFTLIARSGCRRIGEQEHRAATSWPRLRLLLAFTFTLLLNVAMTVPNLA